MFRRAPEPPGTARGEAAGRDKTSTTVSTKSRERSGRRRDGSGGGIDVPRTHRRFTTKQTCKNQHYYFANTQEADDSRQIIKRIALFFNVYYILLATRYRQKNFSQNLAANESAVLSITGPSRNSRNSRNSRFNVVVKKVRLQTFK